MAKTDSCLRLILRLKLVLKNIAGSHSCLRNVKKKIIFEQEFVHYKINNSKISFMMKKKLIIT